MENGNSSGKTATAGKASNKADAHFVSAPSGETPSILLVDDEEKILTSLKRLLTHAGYEVYTAQGAAPALAILSEWKIDLVISDLKMPGMDGVTFLDTVREKWPAAFRILLTAYADTEATIDAINKSHIYQYFMKPWDDNEVLIVVRNALGRKRAEQEKKALEEKIRVQNAMLMELNASLEAKVAEQTREIRKSLQDLSAAHSELRKSFFTSIKVFANIVECREGAMAGHSRRVAATARDLALRMGLPETEIQNIVVAALLHDIGKIGWSDEMLRKPFITLNNSERAEYAKHPTLAQAMLMPLESLNEAGGIIRQHHEQHDGKGFPGHAAGKDIAMGARIVLLANDLDALQEGFLLKEKFTSQQAVEYIVENSGKRYDPEVVDAFIASRISSSMETSIREMVLDSSSLRAGMMLSRDLYSSHEVFYLSKGQALTESTISLLKTIERIDEAPMVFHVKS
ncbi:MAG: response regulator [Nitrospinae bacterium]|nr:response regulator [Nitrospinota bacterium]